MEGRKKRKKTQYHLKKLMTNAFTSLAAAYAIYRQSAIEGEKEIVHRDPTYKNHWVVGVPRRFIPPSVSGGVR